MYEKLESYILWGSTRNFWRRTLKTSLEWMAYEAHKCFLLIIPKVILHDDKNEMKLHWWAFFSFISMWKMVLFEWAVSFWTKYRPAGYTRCMLRMEESKSFCQHRVIGSPMLRDFHTILKLTVLQMQIEKSSAALSMWNGNILLIKRPHHTQ